MSLPRTQGTKAAELAAGYTRRQEICNVVSMVVFAGLGLWLVARLWQASEEGDEWLVLCAVFFGLCGSDLLTGLIHWACDTWGTSETPVVGRVFIRSFREHHVDPMAITRHDFAQTNGEQCLASFPIVGLLLLFAPGPGERLGLFLVTFFFSVIFFTAAANQLHKWAHSNNPPRLASVLQRMHLIISRDHHSIHHKAPYLKHYCITTGWMNAPLHAIGFFRWLERVIGRITGAIPRKDDLGVDAALAILEKEAASATQAEATDSSPN
jgi:ubiquitin-conjugating enzyme E2 variant